MSAIDDARAIIMDHALAAGFKVLKQTKNDITFQHPVSGRTIKTLPLGIYNSKTAATFSATFSRMAVPSKPFGQKAMALIQRLKNMTGRPQI